MGSNEPVSSKQFLSKIEEGQAKMYYDIGKRVHSYFEDTFKEVKQYLQQFPHKMEAHLSKRLNQTVNYLITTNYCSRKFRNSNPST